MLWPALVVTHPVWGEPPGEQPKKPPEASRPALTDSYGDPLPRGVIARLGTERLTLNWASFLTFSHDGHRIAALVHLELRVWDVRSGKEILRLKTPQIRGRSAYMAPLAFSSDDKAIALGCRDRTVHLWDVATGKELRRFAKLAMAEKPREIPRFLHLRVPHLPLSELARGSKR
jgi:WD40 repeat protein